MQKLDLDVVSFLSATLSSFSGTTGMLYEPTTHSFFFFQPYQPFFSTLPTLPLLEFWEFLLLTYLQTLYIPLTQGDTKFSRLVVIIQYLQEPMVETNCSLDPVL